ncbi:MAG: PKD repeat protein [Saprospiraceae bacterium]|jgi:PKD repeat protein
MKKVLLSFALLCPFLLVAQNDFLAPEFGELLISQCSGTLYDSSGPDADYTNNNDSYTFFEIPEGSYLEFTFTELDVEVNFDRVDIYTISSEVPELVGSYDGNTLPNSGNPIQVFGVGALIYFSSDFTITGSGFAVDFTCGEFTDPPMADPGFPSLTCTGIVNFIDNSSGFANSWAWDFGDGNTSTEENPTHTYDTAGDYIISLTACNDNGCDTFTATNSISYNPDDFVCNNGINMVFQGIDSSANCTGILFDSGGPEGDYQEGSYDIFVINAPNASNITLTFLEFDLGNMGEHTDALGIFIPDTFESLDQFSGNTLPNGGAPITYNTSSLLIYFSTDHLNNFSGFSVLWEADGSGAVPTAAFSIDNTNIPLNSPVNFSDESNEAGAWSWNFGDGNTSNQENPTHIYTIPGTYEVSLTMNNCNGTDTALSQTITVQDPPEFTYSPGSFDVTLNAGTIGTETLNLCNIGAGELTLSIDNQSSTTNNYAYQFGFVTNENGADFSWQLLDIDFNILQESQTTYAANQTYTQSITGLSIDEEYYLLLNSPEGVQAIENLIWYDTQTGEIIFEGQLQTGAASFYLLPAPTINLAVDWLMVGENSPILAPADCENIAINFDATELNGGVYEAEITIITNDPANPSVTIPVILTVIGIPEISVTSQDLDFGEIQLGGISTLSFTISNDGTDDLILSGLNSPEVAFSLNTAAELTLSPNTSQTVEVTFIPTEITDYTEVVSIINNAGENVNVNITGTGVAAPSLTVDPTSFVVELISGQDTTLNVNVGNIGDADLTYTTNATTDAASFIFNFTTDSWGSEFSWNVSNSAGEIVVNSTEFYASLTEYSEVISGLSASDTYTLNLLDSFGDGALSQFSITDANNGQVIIEGEFTAPDNPNSMTIPLGSPNEAVLTITPDAGTVGIDQSQVLDLFIDSEGMVTGTYNLVVNLATNDPLQPTVAVTVTLYVIAPVEVNFAAATTFICGNLPAQFNDLTTNVATSWDWNFGDGANSTLQNPTHTYEADGTYTVELTACNSLGCETLTLADYITIELGCYTQNIPPEHNTETITVCAGNVYDSGGPAADYLEGNNGVLIIAPPGAEQVSITFAEFNYEEHADYLYVYDGEPFTGTLLGSYTGTDLAGQTLIAESGILTLQEYTGHFTQLSGFAATFTCDADPVLPTADFTFIGDTVCVNEPFLFSDESLGNPDSFFWDFGQGFTSTEQNPIINFTASDTVNISLTVCNEVGCDTYIQNDVEIILDKTCFQDSIPVTGETTYISFCSGTLYDSGGPDANYLDNSFGTVTIIRESGTFGLSFTEFDFSAEDYIVIFDGVNATAPIIGFYSGNTLPEDGGIITSSGSALTIFEYSDAANNGSGFVLDYVCSSSGDVGGSLRIFNDDLCDGIRRFGTREEATIDSWSWDFGDGMTSTEPSPTHQFIDAGVQTIELTTCYQGDCQTEEVSFYSNKLTPEIAAPTIAAVGEEVHFHGLTEAATHWSWDMGNGETFDHDAPITTYTEEGYHDIHVHLTNMDVHETCTSNHTHTLLVTADGTSSTEDLNTRNIRVFPNPASDNLTIDLGNAPHSEVNIMMTAIDGKTVLNQTYNGSLDVSHLISGTYILQVLIPDELPRQFKITIAKQP